MKLGFQWLLIFSILILCQAACASAKTIDEIVHDNFAPLVDEKQPKDKRFKSILVAVVTPFETKFIPIGFLDDNGTIANDLTVFEIGSLTKGFLGLLLARDAIEGRINLDEPFRVKSSLNLPPYEGQEISWKNLAQHTSGLPRLPVNLKPANALQPYLDYDSQMLGEFINGFKPSIKPGLQSNYSNLGASLIGYGLEKVYSKSLEELLREKILDPFKMNDTRIFLNSDQKKRLAPVFLNGEKAELWQWRKSSVLQAAGALKSTAQDLSFLMKTMMGLWDQQKLPITEYATKPTFEIGENSQIGLFWNRLKAENIVWHNGSTYGSRSFLGYNPEQLVGVIALSNSTIINENGLDPRIDQASVKSILEIADKPRN